ncbi:glycosyltransferase [Thiomonas sp. FB-Cd]|uniref:glycosyltransferase n=1 Tax=Thiomonas sp. FB-Cd TaxID=1158292 RepID=UPI0018CC0497|nr:glycosyltransferase [Thiomonas sp. FB-Cd]
MCDEAGPLVDVRLQCILQDGRIVEQAVQYGSLREDVSDRFAHIPHADASGFLASVAWNGAELVSVHLIAITATGASRSISLFETTHGTSDGLSRLRTAFHVGLTLAMRALRLIRHGHFNVLWDKARRYLAAKPVSVADPLADLKSVIQPARSGKPALFVIDHDLGGGAPQYRQQRIAAHVAEGGVALLLTFHVPTLTYAAQVYGAPGTRRLAMPNLDAVLELARQGYIGDIFFNNAVSFPQAERIPDFLIALRSIAGGRLTLAVHDFYMLCPSHFLINASGKFCNVPDTSVCAKCLPKNQEGFVSFFPARDIHLWRREWRRLINEADELLFFSQSTLQLLRQAYPDVPVDKLHVKPHSLEYFPARKVLVPASSPLRVGVVGNIGKHKGSRIVSGLARAIAERRSDVKITIFGLIDEAVPKEVVEIMGNYQHADLPDLIEKSAVNFIFVPSMVPETFSYVTHEIIRMDFPLVCFDLGAQAEAVRGYSSGRVIPILEGNALLDALNTAYESLQSRGEGQNK